MSSRLAAFDQRLTRIAARHGLVALRLSAGLVFFWFGVLKFFPGWSPAQDLAGRTISVLTLGYIPPSISVPLLAALETTIGLLLLSGRWLRAAIGLLAMQMTGTLMPLFLFPRETFAVYPLAPTLEGQYIIKNLILISAAVVIGATVRGGTLSADPFRPSRVGGAFRGRSSAPSEEG